MLTVDELTIAEAIAAAPSVRAAARSLKVSERTLRRWRAKYPNLAAVEPGSKAAASNPFAAAAPPAPAPDPEPERPAPGAPKPLADLDDAGISAALTREGVRGNISAAALVLGVPSGALRQRVRRSPELTDIVAEESERILDRMEARHQLIALTGKTGRKGDKDAAPVTRLSLLALHQQLQTKGANRGYAVQRLAITAEERRMIERAVLFGIAILAPEQQREVAKRIEGKMREAALASGGRWERREE